MIDLDSSPPNRVQGQLLRLTALFLGLYALSITLAPAARARSWQVSYPIYHWTGLLVWFVVFELAHRHSTRKLPDRDPFLLPVVGILSGWGILTIFRLEPGLGLRQSLWLAISVGILILGLRLPKDLGFLRRYKYVWLTCGLVLTTLTLVLGTNPLGSGPRLWLGCCGFYMQPSEPLKLLLIIYLSAYLADRQLYLLPLAVKGNSSARFSALTLLPLLAPTLVMTGLAVLLLLAQQDLGTATVFLFLYTTIVFIATGLARFIWPSLLTLGLATVVGYSLFDVVRLRIDAWLNPWTDPSGRSYQIIQSLIAAANGGLFGRGPGMGNPGLVPVPHSDFIFVAILEETGFLGVIVLIGLIGLLLNRGLRLSLQAPTAFHRYLAAGLTAHLVGQSIIIIGGNLRLLPLTGVTLPFVSYGGSSLLTSFVSLLILLLISSQATVKRTSWPRKSPYLALSAFLSIGLGAVLFLAGWWSVYRSPVLLNRTDNARRSIADRYVPRGTIRDRNNFPLAVSTGEIGHITRSTVEAGLGSVIGYSHPVYGQFGLEASLDAYLRGIAGNPEALVWWNNLLYGQPPAGLDIRTSLDYDLQQLADQLMGDHQGALVFLNAESGEILAMVSHPTFNPNTLDQDWTELIRDPNAPLLNRATLGQYPIGTAAGPLLLAAIYQWSSPPPLTDANKNVKNIPIWDCSQEPADMAHWGQVITNGCPEAVILLGGRLGEERLYELYSTAGFFTAPKFELPTASSADPGAITDARRGALGLAGSTPNKAQEILVSPLQMALAITALSNKGVCPSLRLALAMETPEMGWVVMPGQDVQRTLFDAITVQKALQELTEVSSQIWYSIARAPVGGADGPFYSWFIGGTSSVWQGSPLALAILLEEDNPQLAQEIGIRLLLSELQP